MRRFYACLCLSLRVIKDFLDKLNPEEKQRAIEQFVRSFLRTFNTSIQTILPEAFQSGFGSTQNFFPIEESEKVTTREPPITLAIHTGFCVGDPKNPTSLEVYYGGVYAIIDNKKIAISSAKHGETDSMFIAQVHLTGDWTPVNHTKPLPIIGDGGNLEWISEDTAEVTSGLEKWRLKIKPYTETLFSPEEERLREERNTGTDVAE